MYTAFIQITVLPKKFNSLVRLINFSQLTWRSKFSVVKTHKFCKSTDALDMFYCTLCYNSSFFPHMLNMKWKQTFLLLVLSTASFYRMSSYQTDCPLFLNNFTSSNFCSKIAPFTAPSPFSYHFDLTKLIPSVTPKKARFENSYHGALKRLISQPGVAVLVVAWWAGMRGHAEPQFLHLLAWKRWNIIHPIKLSGRRRPPAQSRNNPQDLYISSGTGLDIFFLIEIVVIKAEN